MSEKTATDQQKRSTIARRKPERESNLRPTFAALRIQPAGVKTTDVELQTSNIFERSKRGLQNDSAASVESVQTRGCPDWRCGYDFSQVPAHSAVTRIKHPIQANLTVNPPGDTYEQEADRVADDVMRTPHTSLQLTPT